MAKIPAVIAANKMDITGADDNLELFKEELHEAGIDIPVFAVSAATNKGFESLLDELIKMLKALPKSYEYHEEHLPDEAPYSAPTSVEIDDDGNYVVSGGAVDYILDTTYHDDSDSMHRFQQLLISEGIIDALRVHGISEGCTVKLGDWEFDFVE